MRIPVTVIDDSSDEPVEVILFDDVTIDHFLETQQVWRPLVIQATRELIRTGAAITPQHFHWDWTRKAPELRLLSITFYGVEQNGRLEGIMKTHTALYPCQLPEQQGKPLVYIDYVEAAPWNDKQLAGALGRPREFRGIGAQLVKAAVRQSMEEGFQGRVGLHSLHTSEQFYFQCGMTAYQPDPQKQNLRWYEFLPQQAERFLSGENI